MKLKHSNNYEQKDVLLTGLYSSMPVTCASKFCSGPFCSLRTFTSNLLSTRVSSATWPFCCNHETVSEPKLGASTGLVARLACMEKRWKANKKSKKVNKAGKLTEEVRHQLRAAFQSNSTLCARHYHLFRFNVGKTVFPQTAADQFEFSCMCACVKFSCAQLITSHTVCFPLTF